jgi:hypothetical protein
VVTTGYGEVGWLRAELRPDGSVETHHKELNEFLDRGNFRGFVAELSDGTAAGFAEVGLNLCFKQNA